MAESVAPPHDLERPLAAQVVHDALKRALREMGDCGHFGSSHITGEPFTYAPWSCPGCARSVLERLLSEWESQPLV